jgi:RNA polymerase sigma-70 factor (ECF subfamily)
LLCGFAVREIAAAFLGTEAAVAKRAERARQALAASGQLYEVASAEAVRERLPAVCSAIYLLFNEGYHGANPEEAVRAELCSEALRLCSFLLRHPATACPETQALYALMCLHAARLPARTDGNGDLVQLAQQERARWDARLIHEGLTALEASARGDELTAYHLEAAIAAEHAQAPSWPETRWEAIVGLYDLLYRARPTAIVGLNRAIAIAQRDGPERGLAEAEAIPDRDRLARYPFYPAALGELHLRAGHPALARGCFLSALRLSRNPPEKRLLQARLQALDEE